MLLLDLKLPLTCPWFNNSTKKCVNPYWINAPVTLSEVLHKLTLIEKNVACNL